MFPPIVPALPKSGPLLLSIPGISDVSVAGVTTGALVRYRWPTHLRLGGFTLVTRAGTDVTLAGTRLRMLDDSSQELVIDGNARLSAMNMLALRGILPMGRTLHRGRFFAFQRRVSAGDIWGFQIVNDNAGAVIPWLGFQLEGN